MSPAQLRGSPVPRWLHQLFESEWAQRRCPLGNSRHGLLLFSPTFSAFFSQSVQTAASWVISAFWEVLPFYCRVKCVSWFPAENGICTRLRTSFSVSRRWPACSKRNAAHSVCVSLWQWTLTPVVTNYILCAIMKGNTEFAFKASNCSYIYTRWKKMH